jgi:hypothetical protein
MGAFCGLIAICSKLFSTSVLAMEKHVYKQTETYIQTKVKQTCQKGTKGKGQKSPPGREGEEECQK